MICPDDKIKSDKAYKPIIKCQICDLQSMICTFQKKSVILQDMIQNGLIPSAPCMPTKQKLWYNLDIPPAANALCITVAPLTGLSWAYI